MDPYVSENKDGIRAGALLARCRALFYVAAGFALLIASLALWRLVP